MMPTAAVAASAPLEFADNRILVQSVVNGKRLWLIVDTGATGIILASEAAHDLHLSSAAAQSVRGAGAGSAHARTTRISDLRIGSYHTGPHDALIVDLSAIRTTFHFTHLNGVVGYDTLGARYVGFDMDARRIALSSQPLPKPAQARSVAYHLSGDLLTVDAAIDGAHGPAVIDTGDRFGFTVFKPFAQAHNFYNVSNSRRNVMTGIGLGGALYSDVFTSTIDALGFSAQSVNTRAPVGRSGVFDSAREMGSIGGQLLRRYNLIFDRTAMTITAWPSKENGAMAASVPAKHTLQRHATFGAALLADVRGAKIQRIISGGAAEAAGLVQNDVIVRLGSYATPTVEAFLNALHQFHAGDAASAAFLRGTDRREARVVFGAPVNESSAGQTTTYGAVSVDGTLRRTLLTTPTGAQKPLPAVLLLGGIGCYSVDAASNPQDAYLRLAHDITAAGFVTMRIEKSGVGDSEGPPCYNVDFSAEQRAYAAALGALRADPHVDPARVYIFGHSIGTLHAPILAQSAPIAGLIVAEAVGRDWPEYELRNSRRQLELSGLTPAQVDTALLEKDQCLARLLLLDQPETEIEATEPGCKDHNSVYPVEAPYMQQVARINAIGEWSRVSVPVLAIYGTSDFVTEKADHQRIVDVVNQAHPNSASFVEIAAMDHLLAVEATPREAFDAYPKGLPVQYNTAFSDAIVTWLCQREPGTCVRNAPPAAHERT